MAIAIKVEGLTKYFSPSTTALDDVNFIVKEGEIFGILGPNGAGKTTLLKILATLILPTKGEAWLAGYHIIKEAEKVKLCLGFHSGEERSLYWRLSGRENLSFFATLYNLTSQRSRIRIKEILELLELKEPDKKVYLYSTGMRQRLSLARALIPDPPILLLDEPTKSLDPKSAYELRKFLKEELVKKRGKSILWVTHNLREAEEVCDRLAIMEKGKIKTTGSVEELEKCLL
ncbi:MAG: ABC transporter ATP-binding protein [Candidatus Omnitrophica bacterium]|nr:ABC transporter ATP-binding protein [Candidatus Omnitrophota bacterium]